MTNVAESQAGKAIFYLADSLEFLQGVLKMWIKGIWHLKVEHGATTQIFMSAC